MAGLEFKYLLPECGIKGVGCGACFFVLCLFVYICGTRSLTQSFMPARQVFSLQRATPQAQDSCSPLYIFVACAFSVVFLF